MATGSRCVMETKTNVYFAFYNENKFKVCFFFENEEIFIQIDELNESEKIIPHQLAPCRKTKGLGQMRQYQKILK